MLRPVRLHKERAMMGVLRRPKVAVTLPIFLSRQYSLRSILLLKTMNKRTEGGTPDFLPISDSGF